LKDERERLEAKVNELLKKGASMDEVVSLREHNESKCGMTS